MGQHQPTRWYHGSTRQDGSFEHDPAHPGVWLANTAQSASWYAWHPERAEYLLQVAICKPHRLPDLRDPATLQRLCSVGGVPYHAARRHQRQGTLYLTDQRQL